MKSDTINGSLEAPDARRSNRDLASLWDDDNEDEHSMWLVSKRDDVAITLTGLLHACQVSRADLARKISWKPSRVTRALSGKENLTINTLAEIINAVGGDFDILIRQRGVARALQPWESNAVVGNLMELHAEFSANVDQAKDQCQRAGAMLATAAAINRRAFSRAGQVGRSTGHAQQRTYSWSENNHAPVAHQA